MSYHDLLKMYGSEQETAEQREQFPGQERAKAFARFAALQKQYPGIASVKDVARRSWERK